MIKLERKQIKAASLMLSRAFKDELKDIFPDPEERRIKEPIVNEYLIRRDFSNSEAFITSSKMEGIAIWMHSTKREKRSLWRILNSGAIWQATKIGIKPLRKMCAYDRYIDNKHEELVPFPHWYLAVLAVDPQYQGKGYASLLLNDMLACIDKEDLPCYVETEGEKNVSLYQHFGFEVIDSFFVPNTNDRLVAMLRQPREKEA
ncbi:MAG: GNAT family N-acetyltransferase [Dehalococcoidia bacterium]|nr:MAG: GNAT family N-acetyltransferase [Dehalococcoidia bacterium]